MYYNIYILRKTPFIDRFIYAEIKETPLLNKYFMLRVVVDNILDRIMKRFTRPTGRMTSCTVARILLNEILMCLHYVMTSMFGKNTILKFAVFLSHDGSQPPSDVYELFPIELSENYSNSESFIEYNLLSDIKLNCPDETRDFV